MHQGNLESVLAYLQHLENALEKMLDLRQQKNFKNEFFLTLLNNEPQ